MSSIINEYKSSIDFALKTKKKNYRKHIYSLYNAIYLFVAYLIVAPEFFHF